MDRLFAIVGAAFAAGAVGGDLDLNRIAANGTGQRVQSVF
jgi:hypothetical protein